MPCLKQILYLILAIFLSDTKVSQNHSVLYHCSILEIFQ